MVRAVILDEFYRHRSKVRLFCLYVASGFSTSCYSYGTAKSGVGISAMSVLRPDLMMKCVVPVIMAGIIAVRCLAFC